MNLSLTRSFHATERHHIEMRIEGTNITNTAIFSNFGTVLNALNYGLPTAAPAHAFVPGYFAVQILTRRSSMHRLLATVFLTLCLAGQQQEITTFKTTTKLVVVDVFVRAKNGKAIENLKKEDFTLLENGKPQEIAVFEFQHIADEAAQPAGVTADVPARGLRSRHGPAGQRHQCADGGQGPIQGQAPAGAVLRFLFHAAPGTDPCAAGRI